MKEGKLLALEHLGLSCVQHNGNCHSIDGNVWSWEKS